MMTRLHKIMIVGGGAGGLELATQLGERFGKTKQAKIILVDQKLTHVWKPLLHEIAAGTLNASQEETNYFAHAAKHHYQFVLGTFVGLDAPKKHIHLKTPSWSTAAAPEVETKLDYDTLILALGSRSNDFNTKGVREHCHFLDTVDQAHKFHQDLLHTYIEAQQLPESRALNIAIIGAGATGVELAAELSDVKKTFYHYGLNKIDPDKVSIRLIEAAPRILPALSEKTSQHTTRQLKALNIEVMTSHRVKEVSKAQVIFADGTSLDVDLCVWAAGIQAPPIFATLNGFERDHLQRLKVYATLQTHTDPNVFAFGDCAHCQLEADQAPLAPRAQVASQQASFLVRSMHARLNQERLPMFKFVERGSLVSLSHQSAVGEILGQVNVQGLIAKSMYVSLYRLHQANIHGYTHAGLLTAKDLVTKNIGPKIKLH